MKKRVEKSVEKREKKRIILERIIRDNISSAQIKDDISKKVTKTRPDKDQTTHSAWLIISKNISKKPQPTKPQPTHAFQTYSLKQEEMKELFHYLARQEQDTGTIYFPTTETLSRTISEEYSIETIPPQMRTDEESLSYRVVEKIVNYEKLELQLGAKGHMSSFVSPGDKEKFKLFKTLNRGYVMHKLSMPIGS